jgi:hypothetical protein
MHQETLDLMIEFVAAELASCDPVRTGRIVRTLAQTYPDEKALLLCFALTSAAAAVEDVIRVGDGPNPPSPGYKLSALVAADILAVEAITKRSARALDLLHFWRRVDPYFMNS